MRKIFIVIPIFFISLLSFAQSGTRFMDNRPWKEVLERAKRENKMIFVDCYTSWCGPCKQLATQIFPQEKMGNYLNERFVNVKYDVEKGEGLIFEKLYPGEIKVYPTMLILNVKGELIHKIAGTRSADKLIADIESGLQGTTIYSLEKEFNAGNREWGFIRNYLDMLEKATERKQYEKVARAYMAPLPLDTLLNGEIWARMGKFITKYPYSKEFQFTVEHLDDLEARGIIDRYALEARLSEEMGFAVNLVYIASNQKCSPDSVALLQKQAEYLKQLLKNPVKGFPQSLAELALVECKLHQDADRLYERFCILVECGFADRDIFLASMLKYLAEHLEAPARLRHCAELARQLKATASKASWMQDSFDEIIKIVDNKTN